MLNLRNMQFVSPFTLLVSGPTSSGKTQLVRRILQNHYLLINSKETTNLLKVCWIYGQWQNIFEKPIPNCKVIYYSNFEDAENDHDAQIVILDDLMNEMSDDKRLGNLFTKGSHHKGVNVIFITQNLYHQGKQMRNVHLNCHYLILMKNPRDVSQLDVLGRQLNLRNALKEAYHDATKSPYGYLLIDFKQETPRKYMLRTRITPEESIKGHFSPIIYTIQDE